MAVGCRRLLASGFQSRPEFVVRTRDLWTASIKDFVAGWRAAISISYASEDHGRGSERHGDFGSRNVSAGMIIYVEVFGIAMISTSELA